MFRSQNIQKKINTVNCESATSLLFCDEENNSTISGYFFITAAEIRQEQSRLRALILMQKFVDLSLNEVHMHKSFIILCVTVVNNYIFMWIHVDVKGFDFRC